MKVWLVFLFFFAAKAWSQDTLWETGAVGYSRYYVLHPKNRFEYYFHHCTGTNYGHGTIEKGASAWQFTYDSIPKLPHSYSFSRGSKTDSLEIQLLHAKDSTPFQEIGVVEINGQIFSSNHQFIIPRNAEQSEELLVFITDLTLFLEIDEIPMKQSLLTIYVGDHDAWFNYESPHTELFHYRKGQLIHNWVSRQVDEEKPWKKGRKWKRKTVFSKKN
jgi:hypothetical protein